MMNNSMSQLTRYETAIRDARRMRAKPCVRAPRRCLVLFVACLGQSKDPWVAQLVSP